MVWVRDILIELGFTIECPMKLYCDNQDVIHIAENSIYFTNTQNRLKWIDIWYIKG